MHHLTLVQWSVIGISAVTNLFFIEEIASGQTTAPLLARKYTTQAKEVQSLMGAPYRALSDGRIILGGTVGIAGSHQVAGIDWLACVNRDGRVLWSVRADEQPDAASLFPLTSDGDSIWSGGLRKDGIFRFARFNAVSLKKEASIQLTFPSPSHSAPCLQLHSFAEKRADLQVSLVQGSGNSIRVALLSSEMRVIFDKSYTFTFLKGDKSLGEPGNGYLIRLPEKTGYYLCLRHSIPVGGRHGVGILRLTNDGAIKWANGYPVSNSEFETETHIGADGAILLNLSNIAGVKNGPLVKVAPDGIISWAQSYPGLEGVSVANSNFAWTPHRFVEPYLYAWAGQLVSVKLFTQLLGLNYSTGEIEKQVKFTTPGGGFYMEKSSDSIYVALLDMNFHSSKGFLVRLGHDLNIRSACAVRNVEFHWPAICALSPGKLLASYSYPTQKTLVIQEVDDNLENENICGILQKADLAVTKSNFQARPIPMTVLPLRARYNPLDRQQWQSRRHVVLLRLQCRWEACPREEVLACSQLLRELSRRSKRLQKNKMSSELICDSYRFPERDRGRRDPVCQG
ncbi:MAG: hypothetical protein V7609_711 [Verrucomicrobiota bacterium]